MMQRSYTLWFLVVSLLFLGLGGLVGGIGMLIDPTGHSLGMDEILPLFPVPDYTLPGTFLLVVMGIGPLVLSYGLLVRPSWPWAQALSGWSRHHWAWTGTLALGVLLAVWLIVQGVLIGFQWPVQYVTGVNGLVIIVLALAPGVRRLYAQEIRV